MEIRFTVAHALFGLVFGAVVARYFDAAWWGYALAVPAGGALGYVTSLWRLRWLGLKPNTSYLDYMEEWRKRWR